MRTKSISETNIPAPFDKVAECVLKWSDGRDVRNVIILSARLSLNLYHNQQLCGHIYLRDNDPSSFLDVRMVIPEGVSGLGLASLGFNTRIMREIALDLLESLQAAGLVSTENWEMSRVTLIETSILYSFEKVAACVKKRKLIPREKDGHAKFDVYHSQLLVGSIVLQEVDWQTVLEIEVLLPKGLAPSPVPGMTLTNFILHAMQQMTTDLYTELHRRGFISAEYLGGVVSGKALMAKYRPD